jgi:iron complex transport system substrate-binding protein
LKKAFTFVVVAVAVAAWCGLGWALSGHQTSYETATGLPQRIVSLAPNVTEILFALGLSDSIVGVSTFCDYPPQASQKPLIGAYWQPDIEAIIAQRPFLVIGESYPQHRELLDRLSAMGYKTAVLKADTIAELLDAIAKAGDLTGRQVQAAELQKILRAKLDAVSKLVADRPRPKVLWVVDAEPLRVAGRSTFINEMIDLAGGENAIGPTIHPYPPLGIEQVIGAGVEMIIQPSMTESRTIQAQQTETENRWSQWTTIPAVRNKRIYVLPPDTVSRLGPRLADGVEMIAGLLHPECFPTTEKTESNK